MSDPRAIYATAEERYRAGDFGAAEASFRRLLEVLPSVDTPERARAYYGLAISLVGQGRDEQASPELAAALRCNPHLQRARERLAEIDARSAAPAEPEEPRPLLARDPSPNAVHGVVTGFSRHTEQDPMTRGTVSVLSFRLDRRDVPRGSSPPVPVQVRGRRVSGMLQNGDWVELSPGSHGGTVTSLTNLVTGEHVTSRHRVTLGTIAVAAVVVVVVLWIVLAFAAVALEMTPREMFDKVF